MGLIDRIKIAHDEPIYKGRKIVIYSQMEIPKPQKDNFKGYVYVVKFWDSDNLRWIHKVGYSANVLTRIKTECGQYKMYNAEIIWISPCWRESTARRIEKQMHDEIKNNWALDEWIPKERFILPDNVKFSYDLTVRKVYGIREN